MLCEQGASATLGVSYHRTPAHGGSHGSATPETSGEETQGASSPPGQVMVSSRPERRHREMVPGAVLLALAGDRRGEVVAAAGVLAGDLDGLEYRANVAGTLRRNA